MKQEIFLLVSTLASLTLSQNCDPARILFPCVCYDNIIDCQDLPANFDLKGVFDNFTLSGGRRSFRGLSIVRSQLMEIEDDAFEYMEFLDIYIESNFRLEYISPRAFPASRNLTFNLSLKSNALKNESPRERDIFDFISSFVRLYSVDISSNFLTSIPANAFQNGPSLQLIDLRSNDIAKIGSRAFAGAFPMQLWLNNNVISSEEIHDDAFENIHGVDINLSGNEPFVRMEQNKFDNFLTRSDRMIVGASPSERLYCDQDADWLCYWPEWHKDKLFGFRCKAGSGGGADDIWEYCEGKILNCSIADCSNV